MIVIFIVPVIVTVIMIYRVAKDMSSSGTCMFLTIKFPWSLKLLSMKIFGQE